MGAELVHGGVHFRAYAPRRERVEVVLERGGVVPLEREGASSGFFSGVGAGARAGARYRLRLDGRELYPDPASRSQPDGPHGASEVVDPSAFTWTDASFGGLSLRGQVLYEMHVGTFTREGTFQAATRELAELRAAGITAIELMPIAEFDGRFGWGYDGVDLYAPSHLYGRPDDLRAFVDHAHALGLGVILDVVYNHLGPSGNYLAAFSEGFFTTRYENDWGEAVDFETEPAARAFFVENAGYWIDEMHLDGLRIDATQSIFDGSRPHVLAEIAARARLAAGSKRILLIAENEPQRAELVRPADRGGYGLDAAWNDDFHHSARTAVTGRRDAYYVNTRGAPQELVSAVKRGFLFQGQYYPWQGKPRGTPALDLEPARFVLYLDNHDQIANGSRGVRLHELVSPGRYRAILTLLLLAPGTPMLFQGQEFAASAPFLYFADHEGELRELVRRGRLGSLWQFPSTRDPAARAAALAPDDPRAFERCKLDLRERELHAEAYALTRDLLRLRRDDPVFSAQRADGLDGAVLAAEALALRFATGSGDDRLVIVNLGADLDLVDAAEPLLAPVAGAEWTVALSTEDPRYGGGGTPPPGPYGQRTVTAHSALVLVPGPRAPARASEQAPPSAEEASR